MDKKKVMANNFSIINILDLIDNVGENEVVESISCFNCDKNNEIEEFLHQDAIDFAKRKNICDTLNI